MAQAFGTAGQGPGAFHRRVAGLVHPCARLSAHPTDKHFGCRLRARAFLAVLLELILLFNPHNNPETGPTASPFYR